MLLLVSRAIRRTGLRVDHPVRSTKPARNSVHTEVRRDLAAVGDPDRTGGFYATSETAAGAWRIGQTVNSHLSVLIMLSWNGAACCRLKELSSAIQMILLIIIFNWSALLKPR